MRAFFIDQRYTQAPSISPKGEEIPKMEVKGPHPNPSPKERELGGKSEECIL
jgi:hypothetical protein